MKRPSRTSKLVAAALSLALLPRPALSASTPGDGPIGDIQLSYKRDPRVVDPYRGVGQWAAGPSFTGAAAQDRVEVRARVVDGRGQAVQSSPEWLPSDPEMVTVSPSRGDRVTITVHRAGESQLRISAGGLSKELTVRAKVEGRYMVFQTLPPAPSAPPQLSPALKGKRAQVSYALGMDLARTLRNQSVKVDPELVRRGLADALSAGRTTLMTEQQARNALVSVETEIGLTEAGLRAKLQARQNKKEGAQFLARNRKKQGVVSLKSGLQYEIIQAGTGKKPTLDDVAVCHYSGMRLDGSEFDNSRWRKTHEPVPFPVRGVIPGWQQALQRMPAGSKWRVFVPPALAYGSKGAPRAKIGPDTTLVFEIELLAVEGPGERAAGSRAKATPTALTPEEIDRVKRALNPQVSPDEAKEKKP